VERAGCCRDRPSASHQQALSQTDSHDPGSILVLAVVLSLGAAFLFACAAAIQQQATRAATSPSTDRETGRGALSARLPILLAVRDLTRSPLWLTGWGTNLAGFCIQAAALHRGSVALVQPLLVTQLLFTLPLVSMRDRRWPQSREWFAGASVCAGVVVFLSVRGGIPSGGSADRPRILLAAASAVTLVAMLVVVAADRKPPVRAAGIAIAAGLCFALSAVFIKLTATDLLHRGVGATATDWPGYALAASTALGLLLEQEAFASGPLPVTMTAMTITNPVASYLIGVLAFHVAPPTTPAALAAIAGSAVLLTLGTVILAHSPTVRRDATRSSARQERICPGMS
jgi:drug/metabolite transporter (DMT)-like permease